MTLDEHARNAVKASARVVIDTASEELARGIIVEAEWQQRISSALATAYLSDEDPRWQCGFDGDSELWREARAVILDAVPNEGSLLDVGCANGYLIESLDSWAHERGQELALYGLELNPALADVARARLPAWADRIYTGNVTDWVPPRRFTYVRTGLEYVPPGRETALLTRLLHDVVEPDGRLVVGPIAEEDVSATILTFAGAGIDNPAIAVALDRRGKKRYVMWASAHIKSMPPPAVQSK